MGALHQCDALMVHEDVPAAEEDTVYTRLWTFVRRQLRLRPRSTSCPDESSASMAAKRPRYLSEDGGWARVALLRQLELRLEPSDEQVEEDEGDVKLRRSTQRARVQGTCSNCGRLFFRALAGPGGFCGRDCRSSFQYRSAVQAAVDVRCGLLLTPPAAAALPAAF